MLIKKLTMIATERSLTGSMTSLTILGVMAGLVQGMRQHSGGVPIGQVVGWVVLASLVILSTPPSRVVVRWVKTSMDSTDTISWRRETSGAVGGEIRTGRVRVMWRTGESWRKVM